MPFARRDSIYRLTPAKAAHNFRDDHRDHPATKHAGEPGHAPHTRKCPNAHPIVLGVVAPFGHSTITCCHQYAASRCTARTMSDVCGKT